MGTLTLNVTNGARLPDRTFETLVFGLFEEIVWRTPVDTGYCMSRWEIQPGDGYFTITNDAPYVSFLEAGWSKQAPVGMVKPALKNFKEQVAIAKGFH